MPVSQVLRRRDKATCFVWKGRAHRQSSAQGPKKIAIRYCCVFSYLASVILQLAFELAVANLASVVPVSAVGCSNLVPPSDAWLRRTDNEATIGCYTSRQRWNLRCDGNRWKGTVGACSHGRLSCKMPQGIDLRQYLDYSGDDFQCFSPCAGDPLHRLGEIWRRGVDHMNFIQSVQEWGVGPEKL